MEAYMMRMGVANVCKNEIGEWKNLVAQVESWEQELNQDLISFALGQC
jgi:hypothetical protein